MSKDEFWLYNPLDLFSEISIIPLRKMNLNEQLNTLTRLSIIIFIILLVFSKKIAVLFLLISLTLIIILFYIQTKEMSTENFTNNIIENYEESIPREILSNEITYTAEDSNYYVKYTDNCNTQAKKCNIKLNPIPGVSNFNIPIFENEDYISENQKLAGKASNRTLIPPLLVAPPFSSKWKENSLVVRNGINASTNQDLARSGYIVENNCGFVKCCDGNDINKELIESLYTPTETVENFQNTSSKFNTKKIKKKFKPDNYEYPYSIENCNNTPIDYLINPNPNKFSDNVLMADGYHPEQVIENNLPSNLTFGKCQKNKEFNEYNKQTYTSIIQPGVYSRNQIIEPISSNIGISFTQQFEPITVEDCKNSKTFIGHDPNIQGIPEYRDKDVIPYDKQVHLQDIYDPRFSGYGTSYRSYVEPVTGQVRFYYDDIDAQKRPNYMSKSKVDFIGSSIATQAMPNTEYFVKQNKYSRTIAHDAYLKNTLDHRTELQERLLRKANANMEQKRRFPKHTFGSKMKCH